MVKSHKILPITVIVPVFNAGSLLSKCINSINAGVRPSEIIIINDCSTDNSLNIAMQLRSSFDNIRILNTERNSGAAFARKQGILQANNSLISLVDADDFLEINALQVAYENLNENIDLSIFELWEYINENIQKKHLANPINFPIKGIDALLQSLLGWKVHPLGVARKEIYLKAYEELDVESYNADELITRLVFKNCRLINGVKKRYFYRRNPTSTTQLIDDKHLSRMRSDVWLVKLCLKIDDAPTVQVLKNSIFSALRFLHRKKMFDEKKLKYEIEIFINSTIELPGVWLIFFQSPVCILAFIALVIYSKLTMQSEVR